ncbi:MAG: NAD(P)-dependent oxidoreductase [Coprothermobacter sp.]|nr:NAD(P)-dependent oxidoreductase [Coprothermobacter sp.]
MTCRGRGPVNEVMSSRTRVVVLGSRGLAGHMILDYLSRIDHFEVVGIDRGPASRFVQIRADVESSSRLLSVLTAVKPAVVVNCIGVLNAAADADLRRAILLNSYLPYELAAWGDGLGFKLIHLSTDCVFAGNTGDYTETAVPDGTTAYARTKMLGEVQSGRHLTFRTSIVGPEIRPDGNGLLEWFLRQTGVVPGYAGVQWTGVTSLVLARAVEAAISSDLCGLYHLVSDTSISKYRLLKEMARAFGVHGIRIVRQQRPHSRRTLICTRTDFDFRVPDYRSMLEELARTVEDWPELRWSLH